MIMIFIVVSDGVSPQCFMIENINWLHLYYNLR